MEWVNKTCETCTYRVDDSCRLYPPSIKGVKESMDKTIIRVDYYPVVMDVRVSECKTYYYQVACSKWEGKRGE